MCGKSVCRTPSVREPLFILPEVLALRAVVDAACGSADNETVLITSQTAGHLHLVRSEIDGAVRERITSNVLCWPPTDAEVCQVGTRHLMAHVDANDDFRREDHT
jgi:hypothetical protein